MNIGFVAPKNLSNHNAMKGLPFWCFVTPRYFDVPLE
jgi:hypothetical protein